MHLCAHADGHHNRLCLPGWCLLLLARGQGGAQRTGSLQIELCSSLAGSTEGKRNSCQHFGPPGEKRPLHTAQRPSSILSWHGMAWAGSWHRQKPWPSLPRMALTPLGWISGRVARSRQCLLCRTTGPGDKARAMWSKRQGCRAWCFCNTEAMGGGAYLAHSGMFAEPRCDPLDQVLTSGPVSPRPSPPAIFSA